MRSFRFFIKRNFASLGNALVAPLFLCVALAFVVSYSLAYPSYLAFRERSTVSPPWSADVNFGYRENDGVSKLAKELSSAFGGATIVASSKTQVLITTDSQALDNASAVQTTLIDAWLLQPTVNGIYPVDVYTPDQFVLSGNPRQGEGLLVDAGTAQRLRVGAGDTVYIGALYPEGSAGAQTLPLPWVDADGNTIWAKNIVFDAYTISAIVAPSEHLYNALAMFQPEGNAQAYVDAGRSSCTQLYILGAEEQLVERVYNENKDTWSEQGIYVRPVSQEDLYTADLYARDLGGVRTFQNIILVGSLIAFILLLIDGLRKQQAQLRTMAILYALGAQKQSIQYGYGLGSAVFYGSIIFVGCVIGGILSQALYPVWVDPSFWGRVVLLICAAFLLDEGVLQVTLALRLRRLDICSLLRAERE